MVLKLFGLGIKGYLKDSFNVFDGIIVIISVSEFFFASDSGGGTFTVLRGFRLLRIFKIVRSWTSLRELLVTVIASLPAIGNLGLLAFLFMFIYALVGKSFFHGDMYDLDGNITRYNFNTTGDSLVTMFIILTGENWNEIMRIVVHAHGHGAVFFFVSAMVIGNFMLLNLFLAILLKYIEQKEEDLGEDTDSDSEAEEEVVEKHLKLSISSG